MPVGRGISGVCLGHVQLVASIQPSGHRQVTWLPVSKQALVKLLVLHACSGSSLKAGTRS